MDTPPGRRGSVGGGAQPNALMPVSHNQQRDSPVRGDAAGAGRDSTVHDKINQFNSLAIQSKQLERKTADAALKRAMLGREQAETEMRQYRDEVRLLRRHIDEGKQREQKVGERLESVMESYARAKETHAHTQSLWEKEIRRARKETFKSQSGMVKLQEELKTSRAGQKSAEELLEIEKARSKAREQEAFTSRYTLVGVQEQLDQALERVRVLEQERDAFKSLAKSEEDVARIAAEGLLPLPPAVADAEDDEFASPVKTRRSLVTIADVTSSAASEAEIEELTRLWQWEKQRASRALEHADFLAAQCHLGCCPCAAEAKRHAASAAASSPRRKRPAAVKIADAGDLVILSENAPEETPVIAASLSSPPKSKTEMLKASRAPRQSHVFIPTEGVFRTLSQEQAEALEADEIIDESTVDETAMSDLADQEEEAADHPMYSRTPSVDPPNFALPPGCRTSLLSLLDAPHQQEPALQLNIPTAEIPASAMLEEEETEASPDTPRLSIGSEHSDSQDDDDTLTPPATAISLPPPETDPETPTEHPFTRPHTSAAFYSVATTTTTVKVNMDSPQKPNLSARLLAHQRTPSHSSDDKPSFDATNPALTPTMTREQALAQIRERRGRARSIGKAPTGGAVTPAKQKGPLVRTDRRDLSAPSNRVGAPMSVGRRVRS
ncbi:hypothetical protein GQ53DRAFT_740714 [Thozetella sp. PMI_491]|nr:hypothetical protein GQ53DRAFT_740714 [Thozetella sp. PMI_491]